MSGHKTKPLSPAFREQSFKPMGEEALVYVGFRMSPELRDIVKANTDNASEFYREAVEKYARENGWIE